MRTLRVTPNVLTCIRFAIAPIIFLIFVWEFVAHNSHFFEITGPGEVFDFTWWCLVLALVGAVTDLIDGFLARHFSHFGWESKLGRHLDPLADKLFAFALIAAIPLHLTPTSYLYLYIPAAICMAWYSRETTRMRMEGLIEKANYPAKVKTALLSISQLVFMLYIAYESDDRLAYYENTLFFVAITLMMASALCCVVALSDYRRQARIIT